MSGYALMAKTVAGVSIEVAALGRGGDQILEDSGRNREVLVNSVPVDRPIVSPADDFGHIDLKNGLPAKDWTPRGRSTGQLPEFGPLCSMQLARSTAPS